ncbi:MAG: GNAT family N-acetyltransferase [Frankia sp.]
MAVASGLIPPDTVVRPLGEDEVEEAWNCAHESLTRAAEIYEPAGTRRSNHRSTPGQGAPAWARVAHLQRHDPRGAWVAVSPAVGAGGRDQIIGVGLACVRANLWFLSLLAVDSRYQAVGIGRRLLDATLTYAEGSSSAWILASNDPKALRRYQAAGFDLHPGYCAVGELDRTSIPVGLDVRSGDWDRDGDLVEDVAAGLRGAPYGHDLRYFAAQDRPLLIVDGLGYAILESSGITCLGARSSDVARRLLWSGLAAARDPIKLNWLVADQQWAIDVALRGGLRPYPGPSSCLRNVDAPMAPYLPSGAFG